MPQLRWGPFGGYFFHMKYIACLLGLAGLLAVTGCEGDRDHSRGAYGNEYQRGYGGDNWEMNHQQDHRGDPDHQDWDHRDFNHQ
jgi:hypothetical protein